MSNLELLERAAGSTMCQVLSNFGAGLVGAAAYPLWAPQGRLVALGAGSLSMLAANYACQPMDIGDAPAPDDQIDGCGQMAPGGWGQLQYDAGDGWKDVTKYSWQIKAYHITGISNYEKPSTGKWVSSGSVRGEGGGSPYEVGEFDTEAEAKAVVWRIDPRFGNCAYDPEVPIPPPPEDISNPIEYVDNTTNCTYNVSLQGFAQPYEGGPINPVFLIEGTQTQFASGGRIGGCNFAPVIYMPNPGGGGGGGGGGNGPGITFPVPDGGGGGDLDKPWWLEPLIAGMAGGAATLILQQLLGGGGGGSGGGGEIEPATFEMIAPCDYNEDGTNQNRIWSFDVPYIIPRMVQHQVALMQMMQQHLDWKTPTCGSTHEKPQLEGTWISTRWESDGISPGGTKPLRKLFRYRSKSTRTADELQVYWRDFTWQAGSVIVFHKGAWWGTPKVWAASEEEGKRVLRFAAGEAGIDPDQVGEWGISSSRSARYGMPGRMRLEQHQGERWVTRRDSDSGLPEL